MKRYRKKGFTLIELLVVMAVIGLLLSMMSVGYRSATIISKNLKQKAEFHGMEIGLELFAKDFDGYPDSTTLPNASGVGANSVCGGQRLVEALLGRDLRGIEPTTAWYAPNDEAYKPGLYTTYPDFYDISDADSENRRKGPYVQLKFNNVYTIDKLYKDVGIGSSTIYTSAAAAIRQQAPVFTDTFARNTVTGIDAKVGMPILYFKSDPTKRFRVNAARQFVDPPVFIDYKDWMYNYGDNLPLVALPKLSDVSPKAHFEYKQDGTLAVSKEQAFYEMITQYDSQAAPRTLYPYNKDGVILLSAGWDGVFGTKDDITNFENK